MFSLVKKILGTAPTKEANGHGFFPSKLGLKLGVDKKSGYQKNDSIKSKYSGTKKILVLCTQERYFKMTNGNLFSTGNNVQETAVPLMHLDDAGFEFDVVTSQGKEAILEDWSVPKEDTNVLSFMEKYRSKFKKPLSLDKMISDGSLNDSSPYAALFIPGGHGSMVGVPEVQNAGTLIRWIADTDRYMIVVCHGPAALLAATVESSEPHPYQGYKMAIFPDSGDKMSPLIGYLPGHLPWYQCEKLAEQGISFINDKIKGHVHVDRKLYSGDSPMACDKLGKTVVKDLLADKSL